MITYVESWVCSLFLSLSLSLSLSLPLSNLSLSLSLSLIVVSSTSIADSVALYLSTLPTLFPAWIIYKASHSQIGLCRIWEVFPWIFKAWNSQIGQRIQLLYLAWRICRAAQTWIIFKAWNSHIGLQSMENMQGFRDWTMERNASVHSMATTSIREYWAAKKREQRRKEKECSRLQDPSLMDEGKSRKLICSAMAKFWRKQTLGLTISIQRELFQQLLLHPTFQDLQTSTANVESTLLSNIRNTLSQLKVPCSTHELFLKRSSLTMVMNNTDGTTQMNHTRIAGILGVHRRNIAAANSCLEIKDDEDFLPLSACQRQLP